MSYLYDFCMKNKFTTHYTLLLHLYMDTCAPFLRLVLSFLFDIYGHNVIIMFSLPYQNSLDFLIAAFR